jgi:very-short-patch-repair endonuclease
MINDYVKIGKSEKTGKTRVRIKCSECKVENEVQHQSFFDKRPYYCRKCSNAGERNPMFGKGHLISGKNNGNYGGLSEEHKKNLSIARTGMTLNLSEETRAKKRKIGAENLKKWMNENPEKHKETSRKGAVASLKKQADYGNVSSIEIKTKEWLESNNINYEHQFCFDNYFIYDFRCGNILVEVNGDYFHSLPEAIDRDKRKKLHAEKNGYEVIYIWEHEVNDNDFSSLFVLKG